MNLARLLETPIEYENAEEDQRLQSLPDAFDAGTWTLEDVEWIVRWKSPRVMGYFSQNEPEEIELRIDRALNASSITRTLEHLVELNGVGIRVASAILMFMAPDRYTVLDWRAWHALHSLGYLPHEFPSDPGAETYLLFLGACWALSTEHDVTLRELDRVLWSIGAAE